ncbi:Rpn family recombination-promoting nuclease/putative transposase [Spirosoma foliorum]|uniref:Rpn family recombination-promoting nuclease/putative transposase n=1 Tax=Spirosoma foliorum TaxID=2710596 RepID=A0A7G5GQZ3_9BACT|nr:Rpn family recombination-promoting nuclease/putative transposase [Spirosoma foliorum]QMW01285.1 Rpn family recombination-promoting nuclease/putative transposase [Spirosoma foliorum]
MATQPDNPHDRFFKETFSQPEILIDFLNVFAPEAIRECIDYTTLTREVDTFTDEQLAEHFADLVFSVQYSGQSIRLVLLLEHKSYTEDYPHFQINRYLLNLWESQIKQKQRLTPVLPVLVYHGNRRWKKRSVADYFPALHETLIPYLPAFDYLLIDLSTLSDERIPTLRSDYARLTAILLQNSRRKRELARLLDIFADVVRRLIETPNGQRFVGTGFLYLSYTTNLTKVELFGIFSRISSKTESSTMTVAEELLQEGREQGRRQAMSAIEELLQEGRQKAMSAAEELIQKEREEGHRNKIKFIKAMLNLNLTADTIASAVELPLAEVNAIIDEINRTRTT